MHAGSAGGVFAFGTPGVAIGHVRPAADAPVDQQISALWMRVEQAEGDVRSLRTHVDERNAEINTQLDDQVARVDSAIAGIRAAMRDRERRSLEIDVRGLPVIAAGLVLTGLPDSWIGHSAVAWPILTVAVALTIYEVSEALSTAPSGA